MKKRNIFLLILCFILTLSLCGCTKQEYEVLIHDNDNVDFTIKISVDKEQYDLLSTFDVTLEDLEANKVNSTNTTVDKVNVLFQEIAMLYNTYGFNITPINDSKEIGFIAKKTYMTIEEFNAEIEKFAQGKISGLNLKIDYTNTKNKKEYYAHGTLDYIIDSDMGLDDEETKKLFEEQFNYSNMTAKATIYMPPSTQITNFDGLASTESYSVVWQATYNGEQKQVHIMSSWYDYTIYYIIGGVAIVIVLIVAFYISKNIRLKKERDKKNYEINEEIIDDTVYDEENN